MTMTEHWILHIIFEGTCNCNSNALVQLTKVGCKTSQQSTVAFYARRLSKQGRPAPYKSRLPCCM